MVYDCFLFFNEIDLLEIRLNVLKDVVDRFVLVEATRTFTNRVKPLYFEQNRSRFSDFADRIIHVVVDQHPPFVTAWHYESHQRNSIARGLVGAKDDDIVLISDVDEIPNPTSVRKYAGTPGVVAFNQEYFAYYLNFRNVRRWRWVGTRMLSYRDFLHCYDGVPVVKNEFLPEELNVGTTASKIRMRSLPHETWVRDGGWHFTSIGGAAALAEKMRSFSHQEFNPGEEKIDEDRLADLIARGGGPFWKMNCFAQDPALCLPQYVLENRERYSSIIFDITPAYMNSVRISRAVRTVQGLMIHVCERLLGTRLHNFLHRIKVVVRGMHK